MNKRSKILNFFWRKTKKIKSIDIPLNVTHDVHVKKDPVTGVIVGIPEEWLSNCNVVQNLDNNGKLITKLNDFVIETV